MTTSRPSWKTENIAVRLPFHSPAVCCVCRWLDGARDVASIVIFYVFGWLVLFFPIVLDRSSSLSTVDLTVLAGMMYIPGVLQWAKKAGDHLARQGGRPTYSLFFKGSNQWMHFKDVRMWGRKVTEVWFSRNLASFSGGWRGGGESVTVRIHSPCRWSSGTPTLLGLLVPEDEGTALLHWLFTSHHGVTSQNIELFYFVLFISAR